MPEDPKEVVRRFWEAIERQDLSAMDDLVAEEFVGHFPGVGDIHGREAWKQLGAAYFAAFPDLREVQEHVIAEGDTVAARVRWRATHKGELMAILATGREVTVSGMRFFRVAGGRIVEEWASDDMLGLMQQLGAIRAPTQTA